MPSNPTYEESHLLVAATRVLSYKEGRAPTIEQVSGLIDESPEVARVHLKWLSERGIVRLIQTPFESRVELANHLGLEELPREKSGPQMEEEVDEFRQKFRSRQEKIGQLFSTDEIARRDAERKKKLDEELRKFKPRGPSPFKSGPDDE
jgi:DNA-binding transcriptional ArsR family regulator